MSEWRLPKTVVPKHYTLELVPDLEQFVFTGKVVRASSQRTPAPHHPPPLDEYLNILKE